MKTATIADVTQEEFDSAVQLVISGIKSSDPKLDTRLGTVLRSLLVNPEARLEATASRQIEYVRKASSLKTLQESEEAGEDVDVEDVNAVLSNFNVTTTAGTYADGVAKVIVTDSSQVYALPAGTEFRTIDDMVFTSVSAVAAALPQDGALPSGATTILYEGAAGYFFLVPVVAEQVGAVYNIPQGTSLDVNVNIYGFVRAEAYKSFNGGSDVADLGETISKIPAELSIRGFVNKRACEGMLRDEFDGGQYPLLACSAVGYGNSAQRRDKHNAFGVGVGGRIDLYVRNFWDPVTITKVLTGTKDADGTYTINVLPEDFPGSCWVKDVNISDVESTTNSPLEFTCQRMAYGIDETWHDIDVSRDTSEAFNTVWQGLKTVVTEVPPDGTDSSSGEDTWSDERQFSVSVYCLPQATELQAYVDGDSIRSVSTDVVVRCPILCSVEVDASVVYDVDNPMDVEEAKYKIRKYINGLGFVKSLTRSEIVHILKSCGAVSVDLSKKDMLYGVLHDALGKEHRLSGDALVLDGLADDSAMLSHDTAVFVVEPENIQLKLTPNK